MRDRPASALTCFRAYDIRGEVGQDLTVDTARRIGAAMARVMCPDVVVIGRDCRLSGPELSAALAVGLTAQGVDVVDLGLAGTEEVYFAVAHLGAGGGVSVTASHNPAKDNGMKIVGPASVPLSVEAFDEIGRLAMAEIRGHGHGQVCYQTFRQDYARYMVDQIDPSALSQAHMVVNAGNGVAGAAFDAIEDELSSRGVALQARRLNHHPDGRFPRGVPNPLLASMRGETSDTVVASRADLGIAWDGDFDRCFVFDATGRFVDGAYFAALLARAELERAPGATVVHDARVVWPMTYATGGKGHTEVARTGHAYLKRAMRETGAIYGGEMSGHHYFSSFFNCDTGMLPWLKLLEIMGRSGTPLEELVADIAAAHPVSGEMNYRVASPAKAADRLRDRHRSAVLDIDMFDGLSLTFETWRVNLRSSSTEPLLRMNIETRGDVALLEDVRHELDGFLQRDAGCVPA